MAFAEVLQAALALDLAFFVALVMGNLYWLFGFACAAYFIREKHFLLGIPVLAFYIWAQVDLAAIYGWDFALVPAHFLLAHIALYKFTDGYRFLGKFQQHGATLVFVAVIALHNAGGVL